MNIHDTADDFQPEGKNRDVDPRWQQVFSVYLSSFCPSTVSTRPDSEDHTDRDLFWIVANEITILIVNKPWMHFYSIRMDVYV